MSLEKLIAPGGPQSEASPPESISVSHSFRQWSEHTWIFEELPTADIVSVSPPDSADFSPMLLSYTIEIHYKQFNWRLVKKASQVLYLHFALKKRAIIEDIQEKQEQVKEWLQSLGIVDQAAVVLDADEPDDGAFPLHSEDGVRNRDVPSIAALPIIRPALGRHQSISDTAKKAMQNYLNHFLGNMDIVNSREVCKFLEVSKMSFLREYGPKLKEGYLMVNHLKKLSRVDSALKCFPFFCFGCWEDDWKKVWGVLKPGFLALLDDPFNANLLDIIVFDVLPAVDEKKAPKVCLANVVKEHNPLRYSFKVTQGNSSMKIRTTSSVKAKDWISAINYAGMRLVEGWCRPHRFDSFAPQRGLSNDGSQSQWFIDGKAAFEAIASAIENAKSEIFMTGWWLCPELYLRRPFDLHSSSRLDTLLEAKAKGGVKIYILLYKEVPLALKINSMYSKKRFLNIHENVRVLRYPDHISTGVYYWSHHEKLVIVDYRICFIGGLDLCFGRYDTREHRVGDCPPQIWPGKDYYNPRESEPNSWEYTMKDELEREKYPRMPWHDVHCALWGPSCCDIARHFVQRWNHAKKNKAPNEQTIPLLMPHHHIVIPHYMGRSEEMDIPKNTREEDVNRQDSFLSRSSLQDIPLLLPQEADKNSNVQTKLNGLPKNPNLHEQLTEVVGSFSFSHQNPKVSLSPHAQTKNFGDDFEFMTTFNSESRPDDEDHDVEDDTGEVGPPVACRCQVVRSVSYWSAGTGKPEESIHKAYCSLIEEAEHFIYIENQFFISGLSGDEIVQNRILEALYRRILLAYKSDKCFRVIVVIPLIPGFQGGVDDNGAATVRALMHWQYRTISQTKTSIMHNLNALLGPKAHDYISFYGLRSHGILFNGGPIATSQVYVHSKLMIIDDRISVIGSSNINDRSLLGSRDSEIALVLEDKEFVESAMDGKPWKAGKFSYTLRCALWSEHLGLQTREIDKISDPVAETTYRDLWSATAKITSTLTHKTGQRHFIKVVFTCQYYIDVKQENTRIYQDVFGCIPNDNIKSRSALRQNMAFWKEKLGHTTIDLGLASEKLKTCENGGEVKVTDLGEMLKSVRGFLVCFPLEFMSQEDLRPFFNESEFYAPQVFL